MIQAGTKTVRRPSVAGRKKAAAGQFLEVAMLFGRHFRPDALPHLPEHLLHIRLENLEIVGNEFLFLVNDPLDFRPLFRT